MQQRLPSLLDPPVMFANRGARAQVRENTLEAFGVALRLGATGLATEVWLSADGVPVLHREGTIRAGRFRRRPIAEIARDDLPDHVTTLADLVNDCGDRCSLSLSFTNPSDAGAIVDVVSGVSGLLDRTWLCHGSLDVLGELRALDDRVRLVHATRVDRMDDGPERHAARLAAAAIDGVSLRHPDWNGGLAVLFHRFERIAFATDAQHEHQLRPAFRMGLDGVSSDHVDRMLDAFAAEIG